MLEPVLAEEFRPVTTFYCHTNPMITDPDSGIIKQIACGLPTGAQALQYFSLPPAALPGLSDLATASPVLVAVTVLLGTSLALILLSYIVFILSIDSGKQKQATKHS